MGRARKESIDKLVTELTPVAYNSITSEKVIAQAALLIAAELEELTETLHNHAGEVSGAIEGR